MSEKKPSPFIVTAQITKAATMVVMRSFPHASFVTIATTRISVMAAREANALMTRVQSARGLFRVSEESVLRMCPFECVLRYGDEAEVSLVPLSRGKWSTAVVSHLPSRAVQSERVGHGQLLVFRADKLDDCENVDLVTGGRVFFGVAVAGDISHREVHVGHRSDRGDVHSRARIASDVTRADKVGAEEDRLHCRPCR